MKRRARYGHDRLYVESTDGTRLGYWDNKTGQPVADDDVHREAVVAAVAGLVGPQAALQAIPVQAVSDVAPVPVLGPTAGDPAPVAVEPLPGSQLVPAPAATPPGLDAAVLPTSGSTATADWSDLSLNRPGQAAREQAVAHRQAAPVRTLFARVLGVHTDERAWRIGADGEEAVAARLAKLGPEWRVLHAVPVGDRGSDIDHVVIGPAGVFTINAKHHPGASVWVGGNTFMVNGHCQPYVRNSRHEAQRASRLLTAACGFPVTVTRLIAVMGAQEGYTVREQPPGGDVVVLTRREVDQWLRKREGADLGPEQVEAVHDAARRSTTWVNQ